MIRHILVFQQVYSYTITFLGHPDQIWDLSKEIDTYVCVDSFGWIQHLDVVLELINENSRPFTIFLPYDVIHTLDNLRKQSNNQDFARGARRALRKILGFIKENNQNIMILYTVACARWRKHGPYKMCLLRMLKTGRIDLKEIP